MIYLFIGQDSPYKDTPFSSKDIQLKQIKEEFLPKEVEQFNLDTLYGQSLKLNELQEKLLNLPARASKRVIVVRDAQELGADIKEFIIGWAKQAVKHIVLVLDLNIEGSGQKDSFLKNILKYAKVFRFKESPVLNTFNLTRQIEQRKPDIALKVLNQLLKDGERPERIMGGLRYALENSRMSIPETKRRVRCLLECDIEIKTGRLKPVFALEKLIVRLCSFAQPFH